MLFNNRSKNLIYVKIRGIFMPISGFFGKFYPTTTTIMNSAFFMVGFDEFVHIETF